MSLILSGLEFVNSLTETMRDYKVFEIRMWLELSGFDMKNIILVPLFIFREVVKFFFVIILALILLISSCLTMEKFFPMEQNRPSTSKWQSVFSTDDLVPGGYKKGYQNKDGIEVENISCVWDMGEDDIEGVHIHYKATQTPYKPYTSGKTN